MKKATLFITALFVGATVSAQDLFTDDFESGIGNWTASSTGTNGWVVNSAYTGFSTFIPDTPQQPTAITNSPESEYLHIMNSTVCSQFNACNANFDASNSSESYVELNTAISTVGYMNTELSFYYLCEGSAGNSFGELEYSTDNGATWVATGTSYEATGTWTLETVSIPAWDGVAEFKIRFKWQNNSQGADPAFAIDEVSITADQDVTGVDEFDATSVEVYPNPVTDVLHVVTNDNSEIKSISIFALDGATVYGTFENQDQINIQDLKSGVYLLKVVTNGAVTTTRVVKK